MRMRRPRWTLRRLASNVRPSQARITLAVWRRIDTRGIRVEPRRWKRASNALLSVLRSPKSNGPIWAITMARNEADILGETIDHLFAQGVDHVLVADHLSRDGTADVAREHGAMVVADELEPYWQSAKMMHLARVAVRHGAAWVIPFDADELWFSTDSRTLRDLLAVTDAHELVGDWLQYVPIDCGGTTYAARFQWRHVERDRFEKAAFRANWLAYIRQGNHRASVPGPSTQCLRIAHYRYRTAGQMLRKAREGLDAWTLVKSTIRLSHWEDVVHLTEEELEERTRAALTSAELVRDPVGEW